jgi:hypothetical protein
MKKYDRKDFPFFQKMPIKVDIVKIKEELKLLEERNNWLDINPETKYYTSLLKRREHLLAAFADNISEDLKLDGMTFTKYNQIVLTEFDENSYVGIKDQDVEYIVNAYENKKFSRYKKDVLEIMADQNEKNYGKIRKIVDDLENIKHLLSSFKNKVTRARFARLRSGSDIKPHIDHNVSYGVRYHLALETNENCYLAIRKNPNSEFEYFHVPVDGHLYYFNVGFEHFAINNGQTDRIHLVIGVNGIDDLIPFSIR